MNVGEASATTTVLEYLTQKAEVVDLPDEVVLAVIELNGRARKALRVGLVLPTVWMMRREEILAARRQRTSQHESTVSGSGR